MNASARPTLLLLPGTLCDRRIFNALTRRLRGQVTCQSASYSGMKEPHTWLNTILTRMPTKFYVAGFSLGGLLALELLRMAGDRVLGVALVASNAQPGNEKSQRKSAMLRRMWLDRGVSEVAKHVKPAYFHHEAKRRKHERLVFDMARHTSKRSAFEEFAWAAQRPDGLQTLRDYSGKVLAVSGAQDRLCPPAWQRAMLAAQPRMKWIEIARCGHFLPLEAPAQLSDSFLRWIFDQKDSIAAIEPA
jgi:pimeloyl-ACP methyl ester carboxylesterase